MTADMHLIATEAEASVSATPGETRKRRQFTAEYKAEVVQLCRRPHLTPRRPAPGTRRPGHELRRLAAACPRPRPEPPRGHRRTPHAQYRRPPRLRPPIAQICALRGGAVIRMDTPALRGLR